MRKIGIFLFFIFLVLFFVFPVSASNTTRYNITNSAYVYSGNPDVNYGTDSVLAVLNSGSITNSYLELPPAVWEGGSTLFLYSVFENIHAPYILVSKTSSFSEDTLTYNNQPGIGSTISTSTTGPVGSYLSIVLYNPGQYIVLSYPGTGNTHFSSDDAVSSQIPYVTTEVVYSTSIEFITNTSIDYIVDIGDFPTSSVWMALYGCTGACDYSSSWFYLDGKQVPHGSGNWDISGIMADQAFSFPVRLSARLYDLDGLKCCGFYGWQDNILFVDYIWFYPDVVSLPTPIPTLTPIPTSTPIPTPQPTSNPTPIGTPDPNDPWAGDGIDNSFASGYYSYVDGLVSGWGETLTNVSSFVGTPITSFTGYVNSVNSSLSGFDVSSYVAPLYVFSYFINALPASVFNLITLFFIFIIILVVMKV